MRNSTLRIFFILFAVIAMGAVDQFALAQQAVSLGTYSGQREIKATNSVTLTDGFHVPAPAINQSVRIYTGITFQTCVTLNSSPSPSQNYLLTRVFKIPGINVGNINDGHSVCEEGRVIQYFDGLGRVSQSVIVQGSPTFADIIQPVEYDALGRDNKNNLPYTIAGNNGAYRSDALWANAGQKAFYANPPAGVTANPKPYSLTLLSDDPRGRITELQGPGTEAGHSVRGEYGVNNNIVSNTDPNYRRVRYYSANSIINQPATLSVNGWYDDGELFLNVAKDENWQYSNGRAGTSESYTNKDGKLILTRVWQDQNTPLSTYYVYDKFGNLSFVLPPKAEPDLDNAITQGVLSALCYQYNYDKYNRVIEKKLPGVGPVYLIYNKLDQLVMSQDANQRNKSPQEFTFSKYDALGRAIITGIYQHIGTIQNGDANGADNSIRILLQSNFSNQSDLWEHRDNTTIGYSNISLPINNIISYLNINYFDNYDVPGLPVLYDERNNHSNRTDGLATVQKVAILNDPTKMLWAVNYYDNEGRVEKIFTQHFKGGVLDVNNYDVIDNVYSFNGELKTNLRNHWTNNIVTTITNRFEYDHMGRSLASFQDINGQGEIVLNKLSYNEIDNTLSIGKHSIDGINFLDQTHYTYTKTGLLGKSESNLFKFSLKYDEGSQPQYNGNISSFKWGNSLEKTFNYEYDKLNRLTSGSAIGLVENGITYDKMGNIKTLTRDGNAINYNYMTNGVEGNQLQMVSGNGLNTGSYQYDYNGNVVLDGSKNNIQIAYNLLNLPQNISGNQSITYIYSAIGDMLSKQSAATGFTEYINGIQYTNGNLDFINIDGGKAVRQSNNTYLYQYHITDHLGNVRLSFDKDPNTGSARRIQEDDYYPFGKRKGIAPISLDNSYLYNGKELQVELNEYDYGARFYNPEIARWNVQDPLSQQYSSSSPYAYVLNNPIYYTDPDGMQTNPFIVPKNGPITSIQWIPDGQEIPDGWKELTILGGTLNQVSIHGKKPEWAIKRDAAFEEIYSEIKEDYKRNTGFWFQGYPDNLRNIASQKFYDRFYKTNEIDPFTHRQRVIGLGGSTIEFDIALAITTFGQGNLAKAGINRGLTETMEGAAARAGASGAQYSVAFEMQLAKTSYPGVYRGAHFLEANKALSATMGADAGFASSITELGIAIPRSSTGAILGKSPASWVWHHDISAGVMQLVPKAQHTVGSSFWGTLHPNGLGGFALWGK